MAKLVLAERMVSFASTGHLQDNLNYLPSKVCSLAFFFLDSAAVQVWHQAHAEQLPEEPLGGCGQSWEVAGAGNPSRERLFCVEVCRSATGSGGNSL